MALAQTFAALTLAAERECALLATVPPQSLMQRRKRLFFEEIRASAALAGVRLHLAEVIALVERGVTAGGHSLNGYLIAADYADAARFVERAVMPSGRRPYLRMNEIVELHSRALRRTANVPPGTWRTKTFPAFPDGMVPPPPWLLQFEMANFVNRLAHGPPLRTSPILWVAGAHEHFERIHPFDNGNGRVGRLIVNLLLRRCNLPPFIVRDRDAERYASALRSADSQNLWPLAVMIGRAVVAALLHLTNDESDASLDKLSAFATGAERRALYKAAQRGRLRTARGQRGLQTTQAWIDEYRHGLARSAKHDAALAAEPV